MFLPDDARVEHLDHLARRREGAAFARSKSTPRGPAAAARSRSAAGRGDAERGRGVAGVVGRGRDRGGEDTVGGVGGGAAARVREDATARVVVGEESRGDSALGYSAFGFDARTADERGSARAGRFRGASSNVFARRAPVRGNAGVAGVHLVRKETLRPRWHEWGSARRAESPARRADDDGDRAGFHGRGIARLRREPATRDETEVEVVRVGRLERGDDPTDEGAARVHVSATRDAQTRHRGRETHDARRGTHGGRDSTCANAAEARGRRARVVVCPRGVRGGPERRCAFRGFGASETTRIF